MNSSCRPPPGGGGSAEGTSLCVRFFSFPWHLRRAAEGDLPAGDSLLDGFEDTSQIHRDEKEVEGIDPHEIAQAVPDPDQVPSIREIPGEVQGTAWPSIAVRSSKVSISGTPGEDESGSTRGASG